MSRYCIIGTGRQGTAALFDIIKFANPTKILLIDSHQESLDNCINKIDNAINHDIPIESYLVDLSNENQIVKLLKSYDIMLSSVPYFYNLELTKIAIKSKTSMVDLGGHTENVIKQLKYHQEAIDVGISIVPDCGMGPGMNITMALLAMEQLDDPRDVYIWDGGLPKNPKPPWNYSLFFNINGLTNEYDTNAYFIRKGKIAEIECFEDIENIYFDQVGDLEAAVTCGGLSTMPWTYKGVLNTLENKTLRYKGHWDEMKAYRQLGLFKNENIKLNDTKVNIREFYHHLLEKQITSDDKHDICFMRTLAKGIKDNKETSYQCDVVEEYDDKTGFMAMEKWTGWHASIVMQKMIDGTINKGAYPIEKALTGKVFYNEAIKRGYNIRIKEV